MSHHPRSLLIVARVLAASLVSAGVLSAAEPAVPLEKLEVSAPRPSGSPATTTRFTLEALPDAPAGLESLAARAPNFSVAANGARSFGDIFALRGLTNTPFFGDPAVATYLDDMPLGSGFTFPSALLGFASADLHRGPGQASEFGRAGPGGVLQLTTPELAKSGLSGEARAAYGNHSAVGFSALASAANDTADLLVALAHDSRDGYIYNTTLARDIDGKDAQSALARLRWRPAAGTEITLLATGLHARDGVQPLVPLGAPLYSVARTSEGRTGVDSLNLALTAAFATSVGRLSATTGYSDWELDPYASHLDIAGGFVPLDNALTLRQRGWTEEIRLVGDERAAVRWSLGAFLADGRTDSTVAREAFSFPVEQSSARIEHRTLAVFGEAAFKVSDALMLTPGLRAEDSRKTFARTEVIPTPGTMALRESSTALLPKLAASYALNPQTTLFASVGAGYKPGGFSAFTSSASLAAFGPERTTAFEAGLTRESADHRYTATVRAFWYDVTGYQIERSFTATDYIVVNAPSARSRGVELELGWRPTTGLSVEGSVGYTDVTLRRFTDPFTLTAFNGNRAPYVPLYDASLRVEYRHESGWFFGVEGTATGRVFYSEGEDPALSQRAYGIFNARVGWENAHWRVAIRGDNLAGKEYYSGITPLGGPGNDHGTPGAPRTYGLDVTVKF